MKGMGATHPVCDLRVNQMLSKDTNELQRKCKTWAKANSYKFVWFSEGNILIKKANGSPTIVIRNELDLQNISVTCQTENQVPQSTSDSTQLSQSISQPSQSSQTINKNPIIQQPTLQSSGKK